jgi:hypothetical protein
VTVLKQHILSRIEVRRLPDKTLMVYAYDEENEEMTDLCDIQWKGDVEIISKDAVKGYGEIGVKVSYNGVTLDQIIAVKNDSDDQSFNYLLLILPAGIAVILIIGAILLVRSRKRPGIEE